MSLHEPIRAPDTDELVKRIIQLALDEDGVDVTSNSIFTRDDSMRATFTAKAPGVLAGCDVAVRVFSRLDPTVKCDFVRRDGDRVVAGNVIGHVDGPVCSVLRGERVALNFLQRMSGIATKTAEYVTAVSGTRARILDTRKTAPGHRLLDKYAVLVGGAVNHRMGLWDMALIKDNHIDREGSIVNAVAKVRTAYPGVPIEVEARTLDDVRTALDLDVDRIMLDNFPLDRMREAVDLVAGRVPLEASGGITLETVARVAATGVGFISVGDITHSVSALDISLTLGRVAKKGE
ncbi:MAG: carboxylating nicotinate-nucleotide diphosphorylase [Spirochaetaceae bacterium]|nr:MAG: carboxylating nicotinate-nucleotide diphosphorylase [Spirochaetaceae bacterium]